MAVFPTLTAKPVEPMNVETRWNTKITSLSGGVEYRRAFQGRPKRTVKLRYEKISSSDMATLWNFYNQMQGSLQPFYFPFGITESWSNEYCLKSNGTQTKVDLHCKSYSNIAYTQPTLCLYDTLPFSVGSGGSCVVGSDIYFIGYGYVGNYFYKYTPSTRQLTRLADVPYSNTSYSTLTYCNGYIYLYGGIYASGGIYRYDIANNTWSGSLATLANRYGHNTVVYNNLIYIIGGVDKTYEFWQFNPNTYALTQLANMPNQHVYCASFIYNNELYVFWADVTSNVDKYNFASQTWSTVGMAKDINRTVAGIYNNLVYFIGGRSGGARINTINIYDLSNNTLTTAYNTDAKSWMHWSIGQIGNKVYSIGGNDGSLYQSYVYEYNLEIPSIITSGDGVKQLSYTSAIPKNHVIKCNFTNGEPMLLMRFAEDNLSRDVFSLLLQTTGLTLVEVLA